MEISMGHLGDPVAGRSGDQMMGRSGDVRGTSVMHVLNPAQKYIKLTLTGYLGLYSEL